MTALNWAQGRDRLRAIANHTDPNTRHHIEQLGVCDGWNCLEIGAGSGTMSQWIADRVGPNGRVVATDLDTGMLDAIKGANLDVQRLDIEKDPLPSNTYDLIVARYVFEWLNDPKAVLEKIVSALAPQGWVMIETGDWSALPPVATDSQELRNVREAFFEFLNRSAGYKPDVGRQIAGLMEDAGLTGVGAIGRSTLIRGGSPEVQLHKYDLELTGAQMIADGKLADAQLANLLKIYDDPKFTMMSAMTISAWGRKPA